MAKSKTIMQPLELSRVDAHFIKTLRAQIDTIEADYTFRRQNGDTTMLVAGCELVQNSTAEARDSGKHVLSLHLFICVEVIA